ACPLALMRPVSCRPLAESVPDHMPAADAAVLAVAVVVVFDEVSRAHTLSPSQLHPAMHNIRSVSRAPTHFISHHNAKPPMNRVWNLLRFIKRIKRTYTVFVCQLSTAALALGCKLFRTSGYRFT